MPCIAFAAAAAWRAKRSQPDSATIWSPPSLWCGFKLWTRRLGMCTFCQKTRFVMTPTFPSLRLTTIEWLLLAIVGIFAIALSGQAAADKVAPAIPIRAQTFAPKQVILLDGPFKHAMELDEKWLLSLESDRLLSRYRQEAGLTPKATNYGGWEEQGISGHSLGHYLSACAWMYQDTGDKCFLDRVNYIVKLRGVISGRLGSI